MSYSRTVWRLMNACRLQYSKTSNTPWFTTSEIQHKYRKGPESIVWVTRKSEGNCSSTKNHQTTEKHTKYDCKHPEHWLIDALTTGAMRTHHWYSKSTVSNAQRECPYIRPLFSVRTCSRFHLTWFTHSRRSVAERVRARALRQSFTARPVMLFSRWSGKFGCPVTPVLLRCGARLERRETPAEWNTCALDWRLTSVRW